MATIKNKKISDFPKSTGPVRISTWKNRVIISAKGETGFVSTPSRKFNAARFSLLRKLFSPTRLFVKAGFAHFKGRPSDRALKLNYRSAFPQRSSSVKLCFPNIVFSEGSLPIPSNLKASALSSNIILFSWSDSFCAVFISFFLSLFATLTMLASPTHLTGKALPAISMQLSTAKMTTALLSTSASFLSTPLLFLSSTIPLSSSLVKTDLTNVTNLRISLSTASLAKWDLSTFSQKKVAP